MPNPKTGTVTMDVTKAINEIKAGKVEYRVDKIGNVHVTIGRVSFDAVQLEENLKVLFETLYKLRPSTVKGVYIQKLSYSIYNGTWNQNQL